jgi:capsular polysaccharide export protein
MAVQTPALAPARRFLFLQGIASPFFRRLARELRRKGHDVRRINICLGDRFFWNGQNATDYRGLSKNWPAFVADYLKRENITDVMLFGDCRPYHARALEEARKLGLTLHVFEEGYLRPDWITLEHNAVNAGSCLPRDAAQIRQRVSQLPPAEAHAHITSSFFYRAFWDICSTAATEFGLGLYPFYRRHRPHHPLTEYGAWILRLMRKSARERHAKAVMERVIQHAGPVFLLPLQLDSDYQIRVHSPFLSMRQVTDHVFASFAAHAPKHAKLIVKVHPLDNGVVNRTRQTLKLARKHGLEERVEVMDGGHLPSLLMQMRGVVLVNSTVGTQALHYGVSVKTLGKALYDIEGLTCQLPLDRFWTEPTQPDDELFRDFYRLLRATTQINGGFYSRDGIRIAVAETLKRLAIAEVTTQEKAIPSSFRHSSAFVSQL